MKEYSRFGLLSLGLQLDCIVWNHFNFEHLKFISLIFEGAWLPYYVCVFVQLCMYVDTYMYKIRKIGVDYLLVYSMFINCLFMQV